MSFLPGHLQNTQYYDPQQSYYSQQPADLYAQRTTYNSQVSDISNSIAVHPQGTYHSGYQAAPAQYYPRQEAFVQSAGIPINNLGGGSDLYYGEESSFNVQPVMRRGRLRVNNPINTNLLDHTRHALKNTPNFKKSQLNKYRSPLETDTGCI